MAVRRRTKSSMPAKMACPGHADCPQAGASLSPTVRSGVLRPLRDHFLVRRLSLSGVNWVVGDQIVKAVGSKK